jgi:hypothetical protein
MAKGIKLSVHVYPNGLDRLWMKQSSHIRLSHFRLQAKIKARKVTGLTNITQVAH